MELLNIDTDELRGYEDSKLKQAEENLRRELLTIRMDIYSNKAQQVGKVRGLKKSLARVKTVQTEKYRTKELRAKTKEKA